LARCQGRLRSAPVAPVEKCPTVGVSGCVARGGCGGVVRSEPEASGAKCRRRVVLVGVLVVGV